MNPLLAAEASGEDPPGLVDPVVGLMFWTLLVFGLTLFVLWKVAFRGSARRWTSASG